MRGLRCLTGQMQATHNFTVYTSRFNVLGNSSVDQNIATRMEMSLEHSTALLVLSVRCTLRDADIG